MSLIPAAEHDSKDNTNAEGPEGEYNKGEERQNREEDDNKENEDNGEESKNSEDYDKEKRQEPEKDDNFESGAYESLQPPANHRCEMCGKICQMRKGLNTHMNNCEETKQNIFI